MLARCSKEKRTLQSILRTDESDCLLLQVGNSDCAARISERAALSAIVPPLRRRTFPKRFRDGLRNRVTHILLQLTWNPNPLPSSKFSFDYSLLQPRSALEAARAMLTPYAFSATSTHAYSENNPLSSAVR